MTIQWNTDEGEHGTTTTTLEIDVVFDSRKKGLETWRWEVRVGDLKVIAQGTTSRALGSDVRQEARLDALFALRRILDAHGAAPLQPPRSGMSQDAISRLDEMVWVAARRE